MGEIRMGQINENEYTQSIADEEANLGMVLNNIAENNKMSPKDIQKIMSSFGYTKSEIEAFTKDKLKIKKRNRLDEIKEDLYIRSKLRTKLLLEHVRDANLLVTLENMRQEDSHLIDSLTKLGEITPVAQGNNGIQQLLGVEQLILKSYHNEQQQLPKLEEVAQDGNEEH
jgi:SpoVK/Ycf46/Vps4 family AAA+-type ATPase